MGRWVDVKLTLTDFNCQPLGGGSLIYLLGYTAGCPTFASVK